MRSKPSRLALFGIVLVCAALLPACNDSPRLQFLTVAPTSGEIYVSGGAGAGVRGAIRHGARPAMTTPRPGGRRAAALPPAATATCGSLQYAATALFSNGSTQDETGSATWSSSDTSVAQIDANGLATPIGLGTTNIGATFSGISATSEPLAVDQLNSITVSPLTATVASGGSQSFFAIGNFTFAAGGSGNLNVSSQVTWNSSNTDAATIDNSGNITTVAPGTTTITATSCDGVTSGSATLIVGPAAPQSLQLTPAAPTIATGNTTLFTALELLSDGSTQPLQGTIAWGSATTTTATIDANSGIALGIAVGTSTITATESGTGFTGTATLTVQAAAARFAYIANKQGNGVGGALGAGSISIYTVDASGGTFTEVGGSPFPANNPQQVLFHPSGHLMYYINSSSRIITNFIDPATTTGTFIDAQRPPYVAGTGANNVGVIDPLGRFIYVIEDTGTIYGYSIAQTQTQSTNGVLTAIPGLTAYTDATLNAPTWVMTDRAGKYLYVVNDGNATISEYGIDQSTGALAPLGTPTIATGDGTNFPLFGTTDVNGHLYVGNFGDVTAGSVDSVSAYTIDPQTGQLSSAGPDKVIPTATQTINVITDPTGKFIYVLDQNATSATAPGQVFAFNLDPATGLIGSQIGSAVATGATPLGMAIDPTGALLAVDNNVDNTISLFKVTLTGATAGGLSTQTTVPTDQIPQFVVFYTAASTQ